LTILGGFKVLVNVMNPFVRYNAYVTWRFLWSDQL
jgi:hypothetical protein